MDRLRDNNNSRRLNNLEVVILYMDKQRLIWDRTSDGINCNYMGKVRRKERTNVFYGKKVSKWRLDKQRIINYI